MRRLILFFLQVSLYSSFKIMLYCFEANLMSFTLNFVADWTKIVIIPFSIQLFRIRSNQISCNLHLFPFSISSEFYLFLIQRGACRLVTKIFSLSRKPKAWCRFLQASKSTNAPLLIFLFNYVSIESFSLEYFFFSAQMTFFYDSTTEVTIKFEIKVMAKMH